MPDPLDDRLAHLAAKLDQAAPPIVAEEVVGHRDLLEAGRGPARFMAGAAVLTIAAASFAVLAVTRGDDRPAEVSTSPPVHSVTAPPPVTAPSPVSTAPPPGTFKVAPEQAQRAAMVVYETGGPADQPEMALIDIDGNELGRTSADGWSVNHPGRGIDLKSLSADGVTAEQAPEYEDPVPGCTTVHSAAGIRAATCGDGSRQLRLLTGYDAASALSGPVGEVGHWRYALPSPDGKWVLAQWSAECEVPVAYLFEVATGRRTGVRTDDANSMAIGWTPKNLAVVGLDGGECGSENGEGTALLDPATGERRKLHPFGSGAMISHHQGGRLNRLERVVAPS